MNTIRRANFLIYQNGKPIIPSDDGFIGTCKDFKVGTALRLIITLPSNCRVYENKPHTQELKELKGQEDSEGKFYSRQFVLLEDENKKMGWLYPRILHNNSNRLKVVLQEDGKFQIYEVGFCNQDEKLFFRIQLTKERKGTFDLKAPKLEPDTSCDPTLPKNVGRILWHNDLSGVMAIRINTGTARGHWSEIVNCKSRFVKPNTDLIVFGSLTTPSTQTLFENEAVTGIALIEDVPTSGEIYLLVEQITSADQVDDGFRQLRKIIDF